MLLAFILVTELTARHPDWLAALALSKALAEPLASQLGFAPRIRLAGLPPAAHLLRAPDDPESAPPSDLATVLADEAAAGERDIFLIPTMLDFGLLQRAQLAEIAAGARQRFSHATIAYDDVDPCHSLLVQAWARRVYEKLAGTTLKPEQIGLLLAASGDGAGGGRAQSYQLMRLLWEQVGCARADVGFCRHAQPSLHEQLARCTREALTWVVIPQATWRNAHYDEVQTICDEFSRTVAGAQPWMTTEPIGSHVPPSDREDAMPGLSWLVQRMLNLWQERRGKSAGREPSARRDCCPPVSRLRGPQASRPLTGLAGPLDPDLCYESGVIAEIYGQAGLAHLLRHLWKEPDPPAAEPARVFIKVTWHGYAPGTYTDPVALDMLLGALPARAVLLEGHTSSRNLGGAAWDWTKDSRQHRAWIAEQEAEYLRRTGLADVMRQHKAQYLNVTEACWDGRCAPHESIEAIAGGQRTTASSRPGGLCARGAAGTSRRAAHQLRTLQGAHPAQRRQSVRPDPGRAAHGVARPERGPFRARLLRRGKAVRLSVPDVRNGGRAARRGALEPPRAIPESVGQLRPDTASRRGHVQPGLGRRRRAGQPSARPAGG